MTGLAPDGRTRVQLQIALDRIPLDRAVELAESVAPYADWIEMGTSMIKGFGVAGLTQVVEAAGATPVLADLKTVDDVRFELTMAYDAGARSATVMGLAPQVTLDTAVQVAEERERELVVDLLGLTSEQVSALADRLPISVVLAPHVGKDLQATGARPTDLLGPWAQGRRLAIAGGLTADDLPALRDVPGLRVVVGSAVTKADDPISAAKALRHVAH